MTDDHVYYQFNWLILDIKPEISQYYIILILLQNASFINLPLTSSCV